jgi:hypothetical protein
MPPKKNHPGRAQRRADKANPGRIPVEPIPIPAGFRRRAFLFAFKWRIRSRFLFRDRFKEKDQIKLGFVLTLYIAGVGVGMAAYSAPVPVEFFYLAYMLVGLATLLLVVKIWWVVKSRNLFIVGQILALAIGTFLFVELRRIEVARELLLLRGSLIPANDPIDKSDLCGLPKKDLLIAIMGDDMTVVSPTNRLNVVSSDRVLADGGHDLLYLERAASGTVTVNLHAMDTEGKTVLDISENTFEINRNRILDSLSPPRPDKSTILVRDEQGSNLKIRLMNRNTISFRGRLYLGKHYIDFRDKGIFLGPPDRLAVNGGCVIKTNPAGAVIGLMGVQ